VAQYTKKKTLIAHRGASGYAPEHTLDSYRLALTQGADFVEPDLQITKDGVLICMHDVTLERTTNIEDVFRDRAAVENGARRWYVADFTLAEIKTLDAGSWFHERFRNSKVPTFQEMIDVVKGKAGLYPETKEPEVYGKRGFDMEQLVVDILKTNGLDEPVTSASKTPVIIQSFSPASLKRLVSYRVRVPLMLLVGNENASVLSANSMREIRAYAQGIGPAKDILLANPDIVKWAHTAGLSVTAWTFRSSDKTRFATVKDEMAFFLKDLNIDALFTDNPDQFPRHFA
jgi:glycerophosphoryl diester phosphodiesterase